MELQPEWDEQTNLKQKFCDHIVEMKNKEELLSWAGKRLSGGFRQKNCIIFNDRDTVKYFLLLQSKFLYVLPTNDSSINDVS